MTPTGYVINLDASPDRMTHARAELETRGIRPQRIEGLDGRQIDPNSYPGYDDARARAYMGRSMTGGELGCFVGHRRALAALVESGVAIWENEGEPYERLIVRGRANLLEETPEEADLDRIRLLFDDLERKRDIVDFLELAEEAEGVRIFIGSENKLFSLSGSSLVVSPYMNADRKVIGAVGVIGPTRLNYGRIVPIVDYTAQLVGRLLSDRG